MQISMKTRFPQTMVLLVALCFLFGGVHGSARDDLAGDGSVSPLVNDRPIGGTSLLGGDSLTSVTKQDTITSLTSGGDFGLAKSLGRHQLSNVNSKSSLAAAEELELGDGAKSAKVGAKVPPGTPDVVTPTDENTTDDNNPVVVEFLAKITPEIMLALIAKNPANSLEAILAHKNAPTGIHFCFDKDGNDFDDVDMEPEPEEKSEEPKQENERETKPDSEKSLKPIPRAPFCLGDSEERGLPTPKFMLALIAANPKSSFKAMKNEIPEAHKATGVKFEFKNPPSVTAQKDFILDLIASNPSKSSEILERNMIGVLFRADDLKYDVNEDILKGTSHPKPPLFKISKGADSEYYKKVGHFNKVEVPKGKSTVKLTVQWDANGESTNRCKGWFYAPFLEGKLQLLSDRTDRRRLAERILACQDSFSVQETPEH